MKSTARLHYLRIAPRKVRLVASLVKGLTVNEAEAQLTTHRLRPSKPLLKLLRSAVSNAKNLKMDPAKLVIESFRVDGGPMLKRMLPRARGSASPIQKKMSHVTLVLTDEKEVKPHRFNMVVKKKVKAVSEPKETKKPKQQETESEGQGKSNKPGFFKRSFNRKAV